MGRNQRRELIAEIEKLRGSRLLCYVTSDRSPFGGIISDDAVRPFYRQLRQLGHVEHLDLFLYSRGGAVDIPWRIVSGLRGAADTWEVLVPWRANSSATLICLGADKIVFGRHGELGPIDTMWSWKRSPSQAPGPPISDTVSIEDVMAYVRFVREHWSLSGEEALASALGKLAERVDAVQLGSIYRSKSHIQQNARSILMTQRHPPEPAIVDSIVHTLAEQVQSHTHSIPFEEARSLGLPAVTADPALEQLMWRLFEDFEEEMRITQPLDPPYLVTSQDLYEEEALVVAIESSEVADHLLGHIEFRAKRNLPPGLVINVNVNVPPPTSPTVDQDEEAWTEIVKKIRASAVESSVQAVHAAVGNYGVVAAESAFRGAGWRRVP